MNGKAGTQTQVSVGSKLGAFTWITLKTESVKVGGFTPVILWMGKLRLGSAYRVPAKAAPGARPFPTIIRLNYTTAAPRSMGQGAPGGIEDGFPYFTDGFPYFTEAQRGKVICPRSHSWEVADSGSEL